MQLSPTVVSTFQTSLLELMAMIRKAEPHFVRCIKPNEQQSGDLFDDSCVMRQLRYSALSRPCC